MAARSSSTSTTDETPAALDLPGRRLLITGVSAGIGVETARALVARRVTAVGKARDMQGAFCDRAGWRTGCVCEHFGNRRA